jgi:2-dehydropantoate 2-reductase
MLRHAVLGPGGIGALVAATLARAGREVVLLVRPQSLWSYPGRIQIESVVLGSFAVDVDAESQLSREVEVLWVTPKAIMLDAAVELAPPEQVRRAAVVPLMNGIDHVARLRGRYELFVAGAIRVSRRVARTGVYTRRRPSSASSWDRVARKSQESCAQPESNARCAMTKRKCCGRSLRSWHPSLSQHLHSANRSVPCTTIHGGAHGFEGAQADVVAVASAEGIAIDEDALRSLHATVPETTQSSMQKDSPRCRRRSRSLRPDRLDEATVAVA